jgi:hypothetical protein
MLLEELCIKVISAERAGAPARPLHTYTRPETTTASYDVNGWPWLRDHPMITFGDGGSLKSYLALYGAGRLAQAGVNVAYCDWELAGEDHRERLARLFPEPLPLIHYLRCDRALIHEVDRIKRDVNHYGLEYLVFDSAGYAAGGAPEDAQSALDYFRAVRQLGCGSHSLAHTNRSETADQKPFGSSFWHNSARATWFAKQTTVGEEGRVVAVGLYCRKSNLTRQLPALAFEFDFRDDARTIVAPIDIADVDDLAGGLPLWRRLKMALAAGPRSLDSLAEELDTTKDTLNRTVKRRPQLFQRAPDAPDGKPRIVLVSRRQEPPS